MLSDLHKNLDKERKKIKLEIQRDLQNMINNTAIGMALIFAIGALIYAIGLVIL